MGKKKKDKAEKAEKKNIKEKISELLELPEEIILDAPKIQLIGNKSINIENYKGIIEYSNESIRINTTSHMIKITGVNLEIQAITSEEVIISGNVSTMEFIA